MTQTVDLSGEIFTFHGGAKFDPNAIVGVYFRPGAKSISIIWAQDDYGNNITIDPPFKFRIIIGAMRISVMVGPLIGKEDDNHIYALGNVSVRSIDKRR